jgi:hypothetical protein
VCVFIIYECTLNICVTVCVCVCIYFLLWSTDLFKPLRGRTVNLLIVLLQHEIRQGKLEGTKNFQRKRGLKIRGLSKIQKNWGGELGVCQKSQKNYFENVLYDTTLIVFKVTRLLH